MNLASPCLSRRSHGLFLGLCHPVQSPEISSQKFHSPPPDSHKRLATNSFQCIDPAFVTPTLAPFFSVFPYLLSFNSSVRTCYTPWAHGQGYLYLWMGRSQRLWPSPTSYSAGCRDWRKVRGDVERDPFKPTDPALGWDFDPVWRSFCFLESWSHRLGSSLPWTQPTAHTPEVSYFWNTMSQVLWSYHDVLFVCK